MSQNRRGINSYSMDNNENYENSLSKVIFFFFFVVTLTECALTLCILGLGKT